MSSSSATIHQFPRRDFTENDPAVGHESQPSDNDRATENAIFVCQTTDSDLLNPSGEPLTLQDLFHSDEVSNDTLRTALDLLTQAQQRVEAAIRFSNADDAIGADDEFQRLSGLLTELFCCRAIGDGFASVINGVWSAFENLQGTPASAIQLAAFLSVLRKVCSEPLLNDEKASEVLTLLEQRGLMVEPAGFGVLADWLSE